MDIPITITKFRSLYNTAGERVDYTWEEFKEDLRSYEVTKETIEEYKAMDDQSRTRAKDVGGYVAGVLERNSRDRESKVISRSALVIDADIAKMDDAETFDAMRTELYFAHTTHTSTDDKPRLRWIFPLSRPVTPVEYTRLVGIVQTWIGDSSGDTGDDSTDEPKRIMFWPSCCKDAEFRCWEGGSDVLNPDDYLDEVDSPTAEPEEDAHVKPVVRREEVDEQDLIPTGSRNVALTSYAGKLRSCGLKGEILYQSLLLYNEQYMVDPLPEDEVKRVSDSISNYTGGSLLDFQQRDAEYDFKDLSDFSSAQTHEEPKKKIFKVNSFDTLYDMDIPEPEWVIEDLITSGVTILGSPPKYGKSWCCLQIGFKVAAGEPFLGMNTKRNGVLYMALEDSDLRLRKRMYKMLEGKRPPKDFHYVTTGVTLREGFLEYLKNTIDEIFHGDIKLVIVDTLQKIRGVAGKTEGVYGFDYREVGDIQRFALDNDLAIILVHHTNKNSISDDPVEKLNGSTGITGAVDEFVVMSRTNRNDPTTKLTITGRDVIPRTLILRQDERTMMWESLGEEKDVRKSEQQREFEDNPITKVVVEKLEMIEDELKNNGEDVTEIYWKTTATEIASIVNDTSFEKNTSEKSVGRWLSSNAPWFKILDPPIEALADKDKDGRFYKFIQKVN